MKGEKFAMNRIVFITGATSGFGRAAAKTFIDAGWQVIATGRREDRLQALRDDLGDSILVEQFPRLEGRQMIMMIAPARKKTAAARSAEVSAGSDSGAV